MKKLVKVLPLVLALSAASSAFAAVPSTLKIGTDPTYAPFESKNAKGELVGFDIDLAKELCKRINTQCTFVESDFDALIPSLKAKKIDAIISSLSITEKRQQEIAFTDKLYAANARLIAPKGSKLLPDRGCAERQERRRAAGHHSGSVCQRHVAAEGHHRCALSEPGSGLRGPGIRPYRCSFPG
jgi:ABC-type amino acid transport substrate-binding protein